jgi:hypothetical protein
MAATRAEIQAVLKSIEQHEGPDPDGNYSCNNAVIIEATGLSKDTVEAVLRGLWQRGQIEGILVFGGNPNLEGIVRVLPRRERQWGWDGRYVAQWLSHDPLPPEAPIRRRYLPKSARRMRKHWWRVRHPRP